MLCGDIYIRLMHKGSLKSKLICRFALNTSFIIDNKYEFNKKTVDPDSTCKNPKIDKGFKIDCYFKNYCFKCDSRMALEDLCSNCTTTMEGEIQQWKVIRNILDNHTYPGYDEGVLLNYNTNECDFKDVIGKNTNTYFPF